LDSRARPRFAVGIGGGCATAVLLFGVLGVEAICAAWWYGCRTRS